MSWLWLWLLAYIGIHESIFVDLWRWHFQVIEIFIFWIRVHPQHLYLLCFFFTLFSLHVA
jgi:hypothetical protein